MWYDTFPFAHTSTKIITAEALPQKPNELCLWGRIIYI